MVEEGSALPLTGAAALGIVRFRLAADAAWVFADRIQIQQVLVNLMRNALEAMRDSERRELTVTTARLDRATIEIAIGDSGPGLTREVMDRLFEPFVSTKRHGMGHGLSICRSNVESHGGRLGARANPDGGVTFRFTLPASDGHDG
jgi:two-component system sensor kinase FixL